MNENKLFDELEKKGYKKVEHIYSVMKANVMVLVTSLPFIIAFGLIFGLLNHSSDIFEKPSTGTIIIFFVILFFAATIIHEGLHGLTWGLASKNKFKAIKFGFKEISPYCTCSDPLSRANYLLGAAMPFIVLGVIPSIVSIFIGNLFVLIFGLFNIMGAGGDLLVMFDIIRYKTNSKDVIIIDHPSEVGFVTFEK